MVRKKFSPSKSTPNSPLLSNQKNISISPDLTSLMTMTAWVSCLALPCRRPCLPVYGWLPCRAPQSGLPPAGLPVSLTPLTREQLASTARWRTVGNTLRQVENSGILTKDQPPSVEPILCRFCRFVFPSLLQAIIFVRIFYHSIAIHRRQLFITPWNVVRVFTSFYTERISEIFPARISFKMKLFFFNNSS